MLAPPTIDNQTPPPPPPPLPPHTHTHTHTHTSHHPQPNCRSRGLSLLHSNRSSRRTCGTPRCTRATLSPAAASVPCQTTDMCVLKANQVLNAFASVLAMLVFSLCAIAGEGMGERIGAVRVCARCLCFCLCASWERAVCWFSPCAPLYWPVGQGMGERMSAVRVLPYLFSARGARVRNLNRSHFPKTADCFIGRGCRTWFWRSASSSTSPLREAARKQVGIHAQTRLSTYIPLC